MYRQSRMNRRCCITALNVMLLSKGPRSRHTSHPALPHRRCRAIPAAELRSRSTTLRDRAAAGAGKRRHCSLAFGSAAGRPWFLHRRRDLRHAIARAVPVGSLSLDLGAEFDPTRGLGRSQRRLTADRPQQDPNHGSISRRIHRAMSWKCCSPTSCCGRRRAARCTTPFKSTMSLLKTGG